MQDMTHREPFTFDADHPPVLVGSDNGPTPVEYLLHALTACLTAGIANNPRGPRGHPHHRTGASVLDTVPADRW